MEKCSQSQQDMDTKLTTAIAEVKQEVASAQLAHEKTAQELSRRLQALLTNSGRREMRCNISSM